MATETTNLKLPRPESSDINNLANQQALIDAIDQKAASKSDYDTHKAARNPHGTTAADVGAAPTSHNHNDATTSASGFMSATDKSKLNGIAAGAEVNQNAFANVKVGTSTLTADGKQDTLEIKAGSSITLTADTANDAVTIAVDPTNFAAANHSHSNATTAASGFMSATDKSKLDGIASGAQVNDVTSVNGKTGAVSLSATDVGAAASSHSHNNANSTDAGFMSATDKNKLDGIASGAEVNQNAFTNVKVGTTTLAADGKQDTLEIKAGSNITLTPDATNDAVTIAATVPVTSVAGKTGAVTLEGTDIPVATTAARGTVQLSTSVTSTSTTEAATPSAVKSAYDKAAAAETAAGQKLPAAGGNVTGDIEFSENVGVILQDRNTTLKYRLVIVDGQLYIEEI